MLVAETFFVNEISSDVIVKRLGLRKLMINFSINRYNFLTIKIFLTINRPTTYKCIGSQKVIKNNNKKWRQINNKFPDDYKNILVLNY